MTTQHSFALFVALTLSAVACKRSSSDSILSDIATSNSLKTGMFLPRIDADNYLSNGAARRIDDPKVLAAQINIALKAGDTYRVSTTTDGENVLLVERKGMMPVPVASLAANGRKFQWSFFKFTTNKGETLNSNIYIRHEIGTNPMPYVSPNGNESNLFMYRKPRSDKEFIEPMLVSWLNHIVVPNGGVMYRVGNTVLDAQGNMPIMAFKPIGRNMWEMTGYYADNELTPGTIFWAEGSGVYFSFAPKLNVIVRWKKQDDNSMDKDGVYTKWVKRSEAKSKSVVDGATVSVPDTVVSAVKFREEQGFGVKGKEIPVYGPNTLKPGKGVIPVYANKFMYTYNAKSTATGLTLTGDTDPFEDAVFTHLKAIGAATSEQQVGFALDGYSGNGPRPGQTASVTNWNNGGTFNKVRIITNEPNLIARGTVNSWWNGRSDYVGYKYMGEILTNDGKGTGQFIEQTYNKEAGVYNQRMLSRNELTAEVRSTLAAREDTIRAENARIAESMAAANSLGNRADAMANEAYKRARELPGKVVAASATAAVTDKFNIGKTGTPEQQALAWASTGALKEAGAQGVNVSLDAMTGGTIGKSGGFNGQQIVTSTVSSLIGKSVTADINTEVVGTTTKTALEKTLGTAVKTGSDYVISNGAKIPTTDSTILAVADTSIDVTFSAVGTAVGGPVGKGVAAGGAEIAKVGNAEVGALVLTGGELSARGQVNTDQTQALQNLSAIRQSGDIENYLSDPNAATAPYQDTGASQSISQPSQGYSSEPAAEGTTYSE